MSNHYYYFRIVYGKQLGQTKRVSPSTMYLTYPGQVGYIVPAPTPGGQGTLYPTYPTPRVGAGTMYQELIGQVWVQCTRPTPGQVGYIVPAETKWGELVLCLCYSYSGFRVLLITTGTAMQSVVTSRVQQLSPAPTCRSSRT